MKLTALKGTKDVLPEDSYRWQYVETTIRYLCSLFGMREIRTPVIEHTELFLRGVGDTTDIVQKETYTFNDRGDRSLTLKPEGTAGVVRSFVEHNLGADTQPTKMFYLYCPVFRYERPQAGRLREHHQFGVEVFGAPGAMADAEIIHLALSVLGSLGISGLVTKINSIGCPNCRPQYQEALKAYFRPRLNELCPTCRERFERNPLRILDCKVDECKEIAKGAPAVIDYLCTECSDHFDDLKRALDMLGIEYEVDTNIVRGLDYYTKTVFEIVSNHIGSQGTVCGGGRYDGLIEMLGGKSTPGVGFGLGMERLLLVMEAQQAEIPKAARCDVFINTFGDQMRAFELCTMLRARGVKADYDLLNRSTKAQMRYAEKLGASAVIFEGEDERKSGELLVRAMQTGEQKSYPIAEALDALQQALGQIGWF